MKRSSKLMATGRVCSAKLSGNTMTATSRVTTGLVLFLCTSSAIGRTHTAAACGLPSIAIQSDDLGIAVGGAGTIAERRTRASRRDDRVRLAADPGASRVELRNVDGNIVVGTDDQRCRRPGDVPRRAARALRRARRARRVRRQPSRRHFTVEPRRDRTGARRNAADVRPRERRRGRARPTRRPRACSRSRSATC